jgi:undecaprenyl-diphosphatase
MNAVDVAIIHLLNEFSQQSWTFDSFVVLISDTPLFKGYLVLALFWWAWFRKEGARDYNRETVLLTFWACFLALSLSRFLQIGLPHRLRPLHSPQISFIVPYSLSTNFLSEWSSFPSDHAALFFALATGLCLISPLIGGLAFVHAGLIISLPRVYLGLHFPTDILAGAAIGVAMVYLLLVYRIPWRMIVIDPILVWSRKSAETFYPCFFFLTAEMTHLFEDTRSLAVSLWHIVKPVLSR